MNREDKRISPEELAFQWKSESEKTTMKQSEYIKNRNRIAREDMAQEAESIQDAAEAASEGDIANFDLEADAAEQDESPYV